MFRFTHLDTRSRSKLSRCLICVFVISIFLHGITLLTTAIWMSVANVTTCSFLQKYYAPIYLQTISAVGAIFLGAFSYLCTLFEKTSLLVRLFLMGTITLILIELTSAILAGVMSRKIADGLQQELEYSLNDHLARNGSDLSCWNNLQDRRKCCGADDFKNWCPNAVNYTECTYTGSDDNLLSACACDTSCKTWDGYNIHSNSCLKSVSDELKIAYKVIEVLNGLVLGLQMLTYLALHCMLPRLNSRAIVDTYKPKSSGVDIQESGM